MTTTTPTSTIDRIRERHRRHVKSSDSVGVAGFSNVATATRDSRIVSIIATTDDTDLTREVVLPEGADTDYFQTNGNLFVDHCTDHGSGVATLRTISPIWSKGVERRQVGWKINAQMRDTTLARDILKMTEEGGMGASIGFIPTDGSAPNEKQKAFYKDAEWIHTDWELLETSFTLFPCNVGCRVTVDGQKAMRSGFDVCERLLTSGRVQKSSAAALGFPVKLGARISVKWIKPTARP